MSVPNGPSPLEGGSWGRHFLPVRLHDPPGEIELTLATLLVPKAGPDIGLAGSRIFRVLSTIGQKLPPFPASIGTPDRYPTTASGNLKWEYFYGLGARLRAGAIFITGRLLNIQEATPLGSFLKPFSAASLVCA